MKSCLPNRPSAFAPDEGATVGDRREVGRAHRLRFFGHRRELASVVADIGDLVRDDQVMLRFNRGLHIVSRRRPVPLPLVAMDRAFGSVSEIFLSGAASTATSSALYLRICSRSEAILC